MFQDNLANQVSVISAMAGMNNTLVPENSLGDQLLLSPRLTNALIAERVTEVGLTILSRNTFDTTGQANVTATFSDGSNSALSANVGNTSGGADAFFHFQAPSGAWVTSLQFDGSASGGGTANNNNPRRLPIDDLAFITQGVPGTGEFIATGVYDENVVATNTVDASVGAKSVALFTADVATAFSKNLGGVIDFETGTAFPNADENKIGSVFDVGYGSKTIRFTSDQGLAVWQNNVANQVEVISAATGKNNALMIDNAAGVDIFELSIDSLLTGGLDEYVSEIGFTLLPRGVYDTDGTALVTAFYSDNTSELLSADLGNIAGGGETFFYFAAPSGFGIESLLFDGSQTGGGTVNQRRLAIDDLAFVTVVTPEPASFAIWTLLGLALAGYGYFRARRTSSV